MVLLCGTILNIFPVIVGILLILNGCTALLQTWNDPNTPLYSKLLSVLVAVMGVLLVIHPGRIADAIVFCVGAAFFVNGISGLLMNSRI